MGWASTQFFPAPLGEQTAYVGRFEASACHEAVPMLPSTWFTIRTWPWLFLVGTTPISPSRALRRRHLGTISTVRGLSVRNTAGRIYFVHTLLHKLPLASDFRGALPVRRSRPTTHHNGHASNFHNIRKKASSNPFPSPQII